MHFEKYFDIAIALQASDLHLNSGLRPAIRLNGGLKFIDDAEIIKPDDFNAFAEEILPSKKFNEFNNYFNVDFAFNYLNFRVRANFYKDIRGGSGAFRIINTVIKNFDELNLPGVLKKLALTSRRGIILITGPAGNGKSTTLAAIINEINKTQSRHIITLEDPIEFIFEPDKSIINQRETGITMGNFSETLRYTLRQDPDVIMIGELRDYESISAAVSAAETGHLILSTLHTQDASQTVERIINIFPENQQDHIRLQLAYSLLCICAQQLLPLKNNSGRICASEILISNPAVRNLIIEGKISGLRDSMQTGLNFDMHTMEQDLEKLFMLGKIEYSTALEYAFDKTYMKRIMKNAEA